MVKNFFFTICVILINTSIYAGGYQVSLQGQRQIAMGHTGTGLALDGSSIFFNPGALSLTPKRSIMAGASFIQAKAIYDASTAGNPSNYQARNQNSLGTPFSFFADFNTKGAESKWRIGFGVYTPYGSAVKYDDDWKGRFLLKSIDLKAICLQPTLSYSFGNVGIGAGFVYSIGSFDFERGIPLTSSTGEEGNAHLSGKASGMGYNVGIFAKLSDKWTVGANYRSNIDMKSKNGKAEFTTPSSLAYLFPNTEVDATLPLPAVATLGTGYKVNDKLQLAFDANITFWNVYDTLRFDYKDNTAGLQDTRSPRRYNNSLTLRLGAEYNVNKMIDVRMGIVGDYTPVDQEYMTPETPDMNRVAPSIGLGIKPIENLSIDLSLLWVEGLKREIKNVESNFNGTYKLRAIIPGIGITYHY